MPLKSVKLPPQKNGHNRHVARCTSPGLSTYRMVSVGTEKGDTPSLGEAVRLEHVCNLELEDTNKVLPSHMARRIRTSEVC